MIIYQVYPRSFYDTNDDGIGDIRGVEEKLGYIKSLGVDAIWISPFFKSPMKDFGYDISDYRDIDPIFGNMDDFKSLMKAAKELDIGVLVDMVVSHTSDEHPWFKQSKDHENGKSDWYLWANPNPDGSPPSNWVSVFGGSAWEWCAERQQYYFHSFLSSQPDLNMHNPAVQDQVISDMKFWLDLGVSGFRFDACNHIFQDLELRDNPPREDHSGALHPYGFQLHIYDQARPEMLPFLERIRRLLDSYDAFSLAEVGGHDALRLMGDYTAPGRLHSAYSFSLMQPDNGSGYIKSIIATLETAITAPGNPCYALSNHDKPRVASRWAHGRDKVKTAKQSLALLCAMRGDICLYQGEELGLTQSEVPYERLQDPFGKRFWPKFKGRDGCRTPMPWTKGGGFSTVEPWLPIDESHMLMNVRDQDNDRSSVLNFARHCINLRKNEVALDKGCIHLCDEQDGVLMFVREFYGNKIMCIFNMDVGHKAVYVHDQIHGIAMIEYANLSNQHLSLETNGFCFLRV